jgi:trimeric autotransporter adhesin
MSLCRWAWAMVCAGLGAAVTGERASAQQWLTDPTPYQGRVFGNVFDMEVWDSDGAGPTPARLVVACDVEPLAGSFNSVAVWDGTTWEFLRSAPGLSGGARFVVWGNELVSLNSSIIAKYNGTDWERIGPLPVPIHTSGLATVGTTRNGVLIVGGNLTRVSGVNVSCLAQWNGTAWSGLGSGLGGIPIGSLVCNDLLTLPNNDVIVAGNFLTAGGGSARNVARWNGASWSAMSTGLAGPVNTLALYNGEVIAGGDFVAVTPAISNIARWTGSSWQPLGTLSRRVLDLTVSGGTLYAAVDTPAITGSAPAQALYAWNGSTWEEVAPGPTTFTSALAPIRTMIDFQGSLHVGGDFRAMGNTVANGLARRDGNTWSEVGPPGNGIVLALQEYAGELYIGGVFNALDGVVAGDIARFDGVQVRDVGGGISGLESGLNAMTVFQDRLIVAGAFTHAGGAPASNIAAWDGTSWSPLGSGITGLTVTALAVYNGSLYASGTFTSAGGVPANCIARWDGTQWHAVTSGLSTAPPNQPLGRALKVHDGALVVAGAFSAAGGVPAASIASWNGTTWTALASSALGGFSTLEVHSGQLVAGGSFTAINGLQRFNRAVRVGNQWNAIGTWTGESTVAGCQALHSSGGVLYSGQVGYFTEFGEPGPFLQGWNGTTWDIPADPVNYTSPDYWVSAITAYNGEIVVGGIFERVADGRRAVSWARLSVTGAPWVAIAPQPSSPPPGGTITLTVTPATDYSNVTVQWRRNGTPIVSGPGGASAGGGTVSGATTVLASTSGGTPAVLTITGAQASDSGQYSATLSTSSGSTTSAAANVQVGGACAADINGTGGVSVQDIFDFLTLWSASNPAADFNGTGGVSVQDIFDFLEAWVEGC